MIGKGIKDYVLIRAAIIGFRVVAPASLLYLAASVGYRTVFFSDWLAAYASIEAAFYLLVYLPRNHRMQKVRLSFFIHV